MTFLCSHKDENVFSMQTSQLVEHAQQRRARARRCLWVSLTLHAIGLVFLWFQLQTAPVSQLNEGIGVEIIPVPPGPPPVPRKPVLPKRAEKPPETRESHLPREEKAVKHPTAPSPQEDSQKQKETELLRYKPLQAAPQEEQPSAGRMAQPIYRPSLLAEQASEGQNSLRGRASVMSYNPLNTHQAPMEGGIAGRKKGADPITFRHLPPGESSTDSGPRVEPKVKIGQPQVQTDVSVTPRTRPRLIHHVLPEYPQIQGITRAVVTLQLWVEPTGEPRDIHVVSTQTEPRQDEAAIPRFEEAAIAAAQQFRFQPAFEGEQPIRVSVTLPITFSLEQHQERF